MSNWEYNNASGGNGCDYSPLSGYSQNYFGRSQAGEPVPARTQSGTVVIIPSFGGVGYSALQQGQNLGGNCSGYGSIVTAYPTYGSNQCGAFTSML